MTVTLSDNCPKYDPNWCRPADCERCKLNLPKAKPRPQRPQGKTMRPYSLLSESGKQKRVRMFVKRTDSDVGMYVGWIIKHIAEVDNREWLW